MAARRATINNRRVMGPRHNDRNFKKDLKGAEHINWNKSELNEYGHYYMDEDKPNNPDNKLTFEEVEIRFYEEHFRKALDAKNERYRHEGHKDRCQTMAQYKSNKRTCPEETLYYVGNKDNDVDPEIFKAIYRDFYDWHDDEFGNHIAILDAALHLDEKTPHIHERKVWISTDKDGNLVVNQNGALRDMGMERPEHDKPENRYNNQV